MVSGFFLPVGNVQQIINLKKIGFAWRYQQKRKMNCNILLYLFMPEGG